MYYYGKLVRLPDEHTEEGYFQESPEAGESFILHNQVQDICLTGITSVLEVQPDSIHSAVFPEGARRGDFLIETKNETYWLRFYRLPSQPVF